MYMEKRGDFWKPARDVLISSNKTPIMLNGVTIDKIGDIHLLWSDSKDLYLSSVHYSDANNSSKWNTQKLLSGFSPIADMEQGEDGKLHIIARDPTDLLTYLSVEDNGNGQLRIEEHYFLFF